MQRSPLYTILFATAVCVVCAVVVSSAAVSLKERQDINSALEKQRNVLIAAGLLGDEEKVSPEEIENRFATIRGVVIDLETGEEAPDIDPETFDQKKEATNTATSRIAPVNTALVKRLPDHALVYLVQDDGGEIDMIILPVEGYGLWSTLYGFLALDADLETVRGITFYEHKETAGLGGEVDNPGWKAKWEGRKAFDEDGLPTIEVIKGPAGAPVEDPYRVDGLSGATLTARGVTNLVRFWLGENGFGPLLEKLGSRAERRAA
jgi:Na+-transporting NADH:ubiquinone oxidoreductase subunit C